MIKKYDLKIIAKNLALCSTVVIFIDYIVIDLCISGLLENYIKMNSFGVSSLLSILWSVFGYIYILKNFFFPIKIQNNQIIKFRKKKPYFLIFKLWWGIFWRICIFVFLFFAIFYLFMLFLDIFPKNEIINQAINEQSKDFIGNKESVFENINSGKSFLHYLWEIIVVFIVGVANFFATYLTAPFAFKAHYRENYKDYDISENEGGSHIKNA
jgi:ABC-type Fe3+ transport system permease subunit